MKFDDTPIMSSNGIEVNLLFAILQEAQKQTQLLEEISNNTKPRDCSGTGPW